MTADSHMIDVSVVIVNWNTRDILRSCLNSVYNETQEVAFEVVVVDNASSDGSSRMVSAEFPQVVLLQNTENLGFATANNQAMKIAKGRYVLLLNSDTVILDGAIQKVVAFGEQRPESAVLGCRAIWPDGRRQNTCFRYPSLLNVVWSSLLFFRMAKPFHRPFFHPERYPRLDFEMEHDVDAVAGCFFLVRKPAIEQVGTLDEDFFMYGEEAEWCYRMTKAGWKVSYFPGATIIHLYGASASPVDDDIALNKRRGTLLLIHKTEGATRAWLANAVMALGTLLRLPFWIASLSWRRAQPSGMSHLGNNRSWAAYAAIIRFHFGGVLRPLWLPKSPHRKED